MTPGSPLPDFENRPFCVGVDGCRAGWFAILLAGEHRCQAEVFGNITELWKKCKKASVILIDMPIGLKEEGTEERRCDKEARRMLGPPRASSVFRVPCRQVIYIKPYAVASHKNIEITGTALSPMTWGIVHKILEVDKFLMENRSALSTIKEIHPELCFWALNGKPMQHNKKRAEGFNERLQILNSYHPNVDAIVTDALNDYKRRDVAKDDILDALAAAVTAFAGLDALISLPEPPEFDDRGLPMQMLFRSRIAE